MAEPIFKACTRPAMLLSVPMMPLLLSSGIIIMVVMWANYFLGVGMLPLVLLLPHYVFMRVMTQYDDAMFNLLWLKFQCRRGRANRAHFHGKSVYSPLTFKKRE